MNRSDVLYLVAENPAAHGVFDKPTETARKVFCTVRSVGWNEFYTAKQNGLAPSIVFVLADYAEYKNEKIALYTPPGSDTQKRFRIIRTYTKDQTIELVCEEATVDA